MKSFLHILPSKSSYVVHPIVALEVWCVSSSRVRNEWGLHFVFQDCFYHLENESVLIISWKLGAFHSLRTIRREKNNLECKTYISNQTKYTEGEQSCFTFVLGFTSVSFQNHNVTSRITKDFKPFVAISYLGWDNWSWACSICFFISASWSLMIWAFCHALYSCFTKKSHQWVCQIQYTQIPIFSTTSIAFVTSPQGEHWALCMILDSL